jgi:hypothetical protein
MVPGRDAVADGEFLGSYEDVLDDGAQDALLVFGSGGGRAGTEPGEEPFEVAGELEVGVAVGGLGVEGGEGMPAHSSFGRSTVLTARGVVRPARRAVRFRPGCSWTIMAVNGADAIATLRCQQASRPQDRIWLHAATRPQPLHHPRQEATG